MAKVALIVRTKIEFAAIRLRRSTIRGIEVSSAGAKIAVAVAIPKLIAYTSGTLAVAVVGATKMNGDGPDRPNHVRGEHDQLRVAALDEDAAERAEQHGRHEEGEDQDRDGGIGARRPPNGRHQRGEDHVARQLAQRLGGPEVDEGAVLEDGPGAGEVARAVGGQVHVRHRSRGLRGRGRDSR